jgi:hypothetical protein
MKKIVFAIPLIILIAIIIWGWCVGNETFKAVAVFFFRMTITSSCLLAGYAYIAYTPINKNNITEKRNEPIDANKIPWGNVRP